MVLLLQVLILVTQSLSFFSTFCFDSVPLERLKWKIVVISGYIFFTRVNFIKTTRLNNG